jgi:signal transduction histidine kinase
MSLDRERLIAGWLTSRRLEAHRAQALADTGVGLDQLDNLANLVPKGAVDAVMDWLVTDCATRAAASDIERAAKRIYDVVAAMKRFTNLDRVSGPEPVDVESGLRDTVRIMAPRGASKGATLTLEVAADVPTVQAVGSELNQVWTNLIENAMDAVGDSGRIRVTLGTELDHVVVRVIDDGPGIKPEFISRIFDPFFTTKLPGQGVGLGLEIVRQLLRRYGGQVDVRSEPGQTEFTVRLPVHSPVEASSTA